MGKTYKDQPITKSKPVSKSTIVECGNCHLVFSPNPKAVLYYCPQCGDAQ